MHWGGQAGGSGKRGWGFLHAQASQELHVRLQTCARMINRLFWLSEGKRLTWDLGVLPVLSHLPISNSDDLYLNV